MSDSRSVPGDLLEHAAFVRRLARSLLADAHAAEDVAQETWRKALERPPRSAEARPWLARVARNFARRFRRGEGRRAERERRSAREEALPPAEAGLERAETLQRVVDAVRALEEPYLSTVLARYYEDLSPRAIAARDGVPVETVHTRLRRALTQLRASLQRGKPDWTSALGLLAGESPCLRPHAGAEVGLPTLAQGAVAAFAVATLGLVAFATLDVVAFVLHGQDGEGVQPGSVPASALGRSTDSAGLSAPPASGGRLPASPLPSSEAAVSGRVLDEGGAPLPDARLHVLAHQDPFGDASSAPQIGWNAYRGRTFACDGEGRWRAVLPAPGRVFVVAEETEGLVRVSPGGDERWVEAPAAGVDFVLRRLPTAMLEVRVFEGASRRPVAAFKVSIHGGLIQLEGGGTSYANGYYSRRSEGEVLRVPLRVLEADGRRMKVVLIEPELGGLWARLGFSEPELLEQEVLLEADKTSEVVFVLPERGVLRGRVVDEDGAPIRDALVFFGEETRARGDEPFKPLREERIHDGARTRADGWYELAGDGSRVTAAHASHTPTTVDVARAGEIVLPRRGAIQGLVRTTEGPAAAGLVLRLDQRDGPTTVTDEAGRFAFEEIERGAHALWAGGECPLACVRLAAGERAEVELELPRGGSLVLELDPATELELAGLRGVLIGRDELFDVRWPVQAGDEPATLRVERPRPGRYWLVTDRGLATDLALVEGVERVSLVPARAELTVRTSERSVQVVPADADPFLRLMAARLRVKVDAELGARFRLAPGAYLVVGEAGSVLASVEFAGEGRELRIE